jgi:hypothetical protein
MEARPQRLRDHVRRPDQLEQQLTMPTAVTPFVRQTPKPHVDSRHRKTPSRVRFRPPPPGTFRISPCGIQRTALRNGFNLVASRTRCDGNGTRAELTDQEVGPRKFAKSASFVLAPDEYRLEPRARLWAGEADVEGGVAKRLRDESLCGRAAQSVALD